MYTYLYNRVGNKVMFLDDPLLGTVKVCDSCMRARF